MKYTTFTEDNWHGGSITRQGEQIVHCRITTDLHTEHTDKQSAIEHIYTDALLSGAGRYNRDQFIDAVNTLGSSIGVSLTNSRMTITLRGTQDHIQKHISLFKTMLSSPSFSNDEILRIQKQVKNELLEHKEDAKTIAVEQFENTLYGKGDRRYTSSSDALIAALPSIDKKDLQDIHTSFMNAHWTVTIGSSAQTAELIHKAVVALKKGQTQEETARKHTQKPAVKKTILHNIPSKQNIEFAIGAPLALTLNHPEYLPFVFGLNVLGKWGGFTGRLMSTVREKEGLTYGIYAKTETVEGEEQGHYRIMTFFAPDKAVQGLTSTLREIRKIHKSGITQGEYDRFKVILKTQQSLLSDSLTRSVDTLHGYLCADFSLKEMGEYEERLMYVTRSEVNKALKTHLHPDKLIISGAGPTQKVATQIRVVK